ncbi:MAG: SHOCT domain-containing protein [Anaerolineae bacterium]
MPGDMMSSGAWIIFPIIGLVMMGIFMFMRMGRGGFRTPFGDSRGDYRERRESEGESETPLEILRKRYAKGEITREEFDEMKRDL